jgi:hypothetical protein
MNTTNKDTIDNKQEGGAFFKNNPLNEKKNIIKNKESRAYRILKFIDKQINQMLWFLSRYIFNSKNLNKLVKIMPLVLLVINLFLAAPVVAVAVLDFYSSYIVRWFGLQWSPVEWANDLAGGSLKHVLLIIIGVIKLVISIIMIVACCVIFFQTYELNNEYIKNHNFEFLVIITQVFFRLLPYIFLSLSLMIATGFLKVYYKRFCAADQQQTPDNGDMRLQPDAMLHNAATMNMFVLLIASIIFPILNVMMTKKMFNWLRPHIPIGLSLFDNVKLLFVGFLSFIIFTFITDSISSFISNMFEKQLSGNINQDYCDPNDPRDPKNMQNQSSFDKAIGYIKEALNTFLFLPFILMLSLIQTGAGPQFFQTNMKFFKAQRNVINTIINVIFKADAEKKYKQKFMDLRDGDGKGEGANQVNVGDKTYNLPSKLDRAIAIAEDNAPPPAPAAPKYLKTPRMAMSKVAQSLDPRGVVRNLSEKERYDLAQLDAEKYLKKNDPSRSARAAAKERAEAERAARRIQRVQRSRREDEVAATVGARAARRVAARDAAVAARN